VIFITGSAKIVHTSDYTTQ